MQHEMEFVMSSAVSCNLFENLSAAEVAVLVDHAGQLMRWRRGASRNSGAGCAGLREVRVMMTIVQYCCGGVDAEHACADLGWADADSEGGLECEQRESRLGRLETGLYLGTRRRMLAPSELR
jgi:hypothetical protein